LRRQTAQPRKEIRRQTRVSGHQLKLVKQDDDVDPRLAELVQHAVQRAVGSITVHVVEHASDLMSLLHDLRQQGFVDLLRRRAPKLLTIQQNEEDAGRIELVRFPYLGAHKVQEKRALANPAR